MEKLLTIRELAERLSIAPGTAYHWLSAGRLKCIRFSKRCVRFRESDVQKLLEELANDGGSTAMALATPQKRRFLKTRNDL
jgi:excisionase family DNA binding protein